MKKSLAGKGVFPHQYAFTLLLPLRNVFLSPTKLLKRLNLSERDRVLELGPGPGYFSLHVARELMEGRLVLYDIQQEMLDYAKRRLGKYGINNAEYILADGGELPFEDNEFDLIYMITVLGEVENIDLYLSEFARILKPDGIVSVSEQWGDADKLTVDELRRFFVNAGFEEVEFYGTKRNFTINFRL